MRTEKCFNCGNDTGRAVVPSGVIAYCSAECCDSQKGDAYDKAFFKKLFDATMISGDDWGPLPDKGVVRKAMQNAYLAQAKCLNCEEAVEAEKDPKSLIFCSSQCHCDFFVELSKTSHCGFDNKKIIISESKKSVRKKLEGIYISPEAYEDMKNWGTEDSEEITVKFTEGAYRPPRIVDTPED